MIISDIQLYELLASKIGRLEAQGLVEFVEAKMDKKLEEKTNILVTKEDLSNTKVEIVKWMVATGIALAGIMVALMVGMVKYLHAVN
jgi:cytochrome c-type biogenesis protein CcmH/NrfG